MPRVLLIPLLALLLLVPATAEGKSNVHLRGTVAAKAPAAHRMSMRSSRVAFTLRVPGSQSKIKTGQRVELRGSTLTARGGESDVLARGVTVLSSKPVASTQAPMADDDDDDDDNGAQANDDDDDDDGAQAHDDDDDDDHSSGPGSGDDDGEDDD